MILRSKFLIVFGLIATVVSCSTESSKIDYSKVFRYNEHSNISSLDPAFAKNQAHIWAVNQLFNGLVQLDDAMHIQPAIAKSWSISDDGLNYQFTLRNDVYFHKHSAFGKDSTRTVVAKDFEYSFKRLLDRNLAAPGGWVLQNVAQFQAKNDSVFHIELKQPFPPFLSLLSMKYCSVVPKEAIDYYGTDFRAHPVGTGPFQFKLWVENTKLVLRKNPQYFEVENEERLPKLEAVAITFLPDKQSEFLQFVQGNIDFLNSIDPSYKDDILTQDGKLSARYSDQIEMISGPYLNTEYLGILMDDISEEIQSEKIRHAINLGFDRVKMIQFLRNGIGTPAVNGFIPKGLPAFSQMKGFDYNPELAKQLVREFKEETGIQNPSIRISTNGQYVDLCEFIQKELQQIGLDVAVDVVPPSTLKQSKANGKLPIFRASWIADYPDSENYLSLFYSKNFAPNGPNYMHFADQEFDALYETCIKTVDVQKRIALYRKMDSIIIAKAPVVPLYYDQVIRFTRKNVQGMTINPVNLLNLKSVSKK